MKRDPKQILKIIEANREQIKGFGVRRLGLFGSAARGEATKAATWIFWWNWKTKPLTPIWT